MVLVSPTGGDMNNNTIVALRWVLVSPTSGGSDVSYTYNTTPGIGRAFCSA